MILAVNSPPHGASGAKQGQATTPGPRDLMNKGLQCLFPCQQEQGHGRTAILAVNGGDGTTRYKYSLQVRFKVMANKKQRK